MTETGVQSPKPNKALIGVTAVLALIAMGLAVYLTYISVTGRAAAGCGGDSGCGEVLSSQWSRLGPIPVSLMAAGAYLATLIGLALIAFNTDNSKRSGDFLLTNGAVWFVGAAAWFTYIQAVKLELRPDEFCPYCMVGHGIGLVLGLVLIPAIIWRRLALRSIVGFTLGAMAVCSLIFLQTTLPYQPEVVSADNLFVDRDGEAWIQGRRYVSMFGGQLQFFVDEEPHLGDQEAKQVVGVVYDYACPHCRELHVLLNQAIDDDPERFVLVALPLSIHGGVNPYTDDDNARFEDSYELATLSLAVYAVAPDKWAEYDRWLFAEGESDGFPRSVESARERAEALVGREALSDQLDGTQLRAHHDVVDRNIELLGLIPPERRYIPVTATPGGSTYLTTRYYDIQVLYDYLDEAASNATEQP